MNRFEASEPVEAVERAPGLFFDPFAPALRTDPYPVYRRFREQGGIHGGRAPMPSFPRCHFVFRHDDVVEVLRDPRFGRERALADGGRKPDIPGAATVIRRLARRMVFFIDPPEHTRVRRMLQAGFTAELNRQVEEAARDVAADLVADLLRSRGTVDLVHAFTGELPPRVVGRIMGIPETDRLRVRRWSAQMASIIDVRRHDGLESPSRATAELASYLRERMRGGAGKSGCPASALIERIRDAGADAGAREDEVLANLVFLVAAAQETTVNFLGNALVALLRHPEEREKLAAEPDLMGPAVEELLRWDSPVQMVFRTVHEPAELAGVALEPGDHLALILGSANRDPEAFPDPDRLDLGRRPGRQAGRDNRHVAFSAGVHRCMGTAVARAEARAALDVLRPLLPRLELTGEPVWGEGLAFRGPAFVPVQLR